MKNKDEQLIKDMRSGRVTASSVFMKFVSDKDICNFAVCFYEGEDGKYYDSRVKKFFYNKFVTYKVGNKMEVLKLLRKLTDDDRYKDRCLMFFIDRDYDEEGLNLHKDLFVTPYHSIENFYVHKECLEEILQSEFGIIKTSDDFKNCITDYMLREEEFNEYLLEFNTLAYLRRKKKIPNDVVSFNDIKTSALVKVNLDKVEKDPKYEINIQSIKDVLKFTEEEIEEAKEFLKNKGNFSCNFRGKNQFDFFVMFINDLKRKKDEYFSESCNSVHINITTNRLSELTQYAITPASLEKFLTEHQKIFE